MVLPSVLGTITKTYKKNMSFWIWGVIPEATSGTLTLYDPSGKIGKRKKFSANIGSNFAMITGLIGGAIPAGKYQATLETNRGEYLSQDITLLNESAANTNLTVTTNPSGCTPVIRDAGAITIWKEPTPFTVNTYPGISWFHWGEYVPFGTTLGRIGEGGFVATSAGEADFATTPDTYIFRRKPPEFSFEGETRSAYEFDLTRNELLPGQSQTVHCDLVPAKDGYGSITLESYPGGADVYLNGIFKGVSPLTIHNVKKIYDKTYSLRWKAPGYKANAFSIPSKWINIYLVSFEIPEGTGRPGPEPPWPPSPGEPPPEEPPPEEPEEPIVCDARWNVWDPSPPGVKIGNMRTMFWGTFGCVVLKDGKKMILSCNHVLTSFVGKIGDTIYQGGQPHKIATLVNFVPFQSINTVDCGIAAPLPGVTIIPNIPITCEEYEPSIIPVGTTTAFAGQNIKKSGAMTGFTTGTVISTSTTVIVSGRKFEDVIIGSRIGAQGDSGSLVLDDNNKALGLLFAGSNESIVICKIAPCLEKLGCTLYTTKTPPPPTESNIECSTNPTGASIWLKKH